MHEGTFTEQIVEVILSELKKNSAGKPKSVTVRVGEKFHLVPSSVKMHFDVLTKGTPLEHVTLNLLEEEMSVYCLTCNQSGAVLDHHLIVCPSCYSKDVKITMGDQIIVESIEMES